MIQFIKIYIGPQRCPNAVVSQKGESMNIVSSSIMTYECSKIFAALPHLTFNLKVRGHKMPEIRDFLHHSIRHCLHVPLTALSPSVVQLLQVIAAVSRVVVGLVHQVAVPTIPSLPQQVLLKSRKLGENLS